MIKVLVVEDSPTVRDFLVRVLQSDPALEVVATAADGEAALAAVVANPPDAITMDITMPRMDGLEATRRIMQTRPTPIIIVSATLPAEEAATFGALEAGALAVIRRPLGLGHNQHEQNAAELIRTVKLMAEVKLVKRWPPPAKPAPVSAPPASLLVRQPKAELIAIGGSTGAPVALETILSGLPKPYPLPILVVQHIAPGFVAGFAHWLAQASGLPVRLAADADPLLPGHVYLAPDQLHLGVKRPAQAILSNAPPEHGLRPSVSFLFRSAAQAFGKHVVGVLLSGMGEDGADALKLLRQQGALTIVQDQETSVVYSMPGEAVKRGAALWALSPAVIAKTLAGLGQPYPPRETHESGAGSPKPANQ